MEISSSPGPSPKFQSVSAQTQFGYGWVLKSAFLEFRDPELHIRHPERSEGSCSFSCGVVLRFENLCLSRRDPTAKRPLDDEIKCGGHRVLFLNRVNRVPFCDGVRTVHVGSNLLSNKDLLVPIPFVFGDISANGSRLKIEATWDFSIPIPSHIRKYCRTKKTFAISVLDKLQLFHNVTWRSTGFGHHEVCSPIHIHGPVRAG